MSHLGSALLLITGVSSLAIPPGIPPSEYSYQLINDVITSMEKLIGYYQRTYHEMNMDGIFGLKTAEGQCRLILQKKKRVKLPLVYVKRLEIILTNTVNISDLALPHLKRGDEEYYKRGAKLLIPWTVWLDERELDDSLVWKDNQLDPGFEFNETVSDLCLGELIDSPGTCVISDACARIMLKKRGGSGYIITHQVIYAHIAHLMNCVAPINRMMTRDVNETWALSRWENELCANILTTITEKLVAEMDITHDQDLFMEENSRFQAKLKRSKLMSVKFTAEAEELRIKQDLFMEKVFVCGVLGFSVFLRPSFARKILQWQDESGCFAPLNKRLKLGLLARDSPVSKRLKQGLLAGESSPVGRQSRRLMEEKDLSDGCLAHKTSVALATLSSLLHAFIEGDHRARHYQPPRRPRPTRKVVIDPGLEVVNLDGIASFKSLGPPDSEAKLVQPGLVRYSSAQWMFPLVTVTLTLVLLWRVRACRICMRNWK